MTDSRRRFSIRTVLTVVGLIVLVAAAAFGINALRGNQAEVRRTYELVYPRRNTITATVNATGQMQPAQVANLSFSAPGRVAEVLVAIGDQVKQGDALARLDSREQQVRVIQAASQLAQAQASYEKLVEGAGGPGKALENCYFSNHYSKDDKSERTQTFVKAYMSEYGKPPSGLAALGYDAMKIIAEFATSMRFSHLPPAVVQLACRALADSLACAMAAAPTMVLPAPVGAATSTLLPSSIPAQEASWNGSRSKLSRLRKASTVGRPRRVLDAAKRSAGGGCSLMQCSGW